MFHVKHAGRLPGGGVAPAPGAKPLKLIDMKKYISLIVMCVVAVCLIAASFCISFTSASEYKVLNGIVISVLSVSAWVCCTILRVADDLR